MTEQEIKEQLLKQLKKDLLDAQLTNSDININKLKTTYRRTFINNGFFYVDQINDPSTYYFLYDADKRPLDIKQEQFSDEEAIIKGYKYKIAYTLDIEAMKDYYERPIKTIIELSTGKKRKGSITPLDLIFCQLPLLAKELWAIQYKGKEIKKHLTLKGIELLKTKYINCFSNLEYKFIGKQGIEEPLLVGTPKNKSLQKCLNTYLSNIEFLSNHQEITNYKDFIDYQLENLKSEKESKIIEQDKNKILVEALTKKYEIDINNLDIAIIHQYKSQRTYNSKSCIENPISSLSASEEEELEKLVEINKIIESIYNYLRYGTPGLKDQNEESIIKGYENNPNNINYAYFIIAKMFYISDELESININIESINKDLEDIEKNLNNRFDYTLFNKLLNARISLLKTINNEATKSNQITNFLLATIPNNKEITKNTELINKYKEIINKLNQLERDKKQLKFLDPNDEEEKKQQIEHEIELNKKELKTKYNNHWQLNIKSFVDAFHNEQINKNRRIAEIVNNFILNGSKEEDSILYFKNMSGAKIIDNGLNVVITHDYFKGCELSIPKDYYLDYESNKDRINLLLQLIIKRTCNAYLKDNNDYIVLNNEELSKAIYSNEDKLRENVKKDLETLKSFNLNASININTKEKIRISNNIIDSIIYGNNNIIKLRLNSEFINVILAFNSVIYLNDGLFDTNNNFNALEQAMYINFISILTVQDKNKQPKGKIKLSNLLARLPLATPTNLKQLGNRKIGREIKEPLENSFNHFNETGILNISFDKQTIKNYHVKGLDLNNTELTVKNPNEPKK